jgi:outer membrane beta-barrel protein
MQHGIKKQMKSTIFFIVAMILVCYLFVAQTATAQIKSSGASTMTILLGGYAFDANQDLETGHAYGLGLGYYLNLNWAVEGFFTQINAELNTDRTIATAYLYHLDELYHFRPAESFVPYLAAGLGGIIFNLENVDSDHDWAVNYGGGFKYFITDNIAFRGDIRHVITFDETYNNIVYAVGLTFSFGKTVNKKPVKAMKNTEKKVVILASEPKVEEKVKIAAVEPKIIVLAFEDIHFDFGQSILTLEAKTILKRNILLLKKFPKVHVRIAAYTSASGQKDFNQKLSEKRAQVVEEFLIGEGLITQGRITKIGYGETNPALHEAAPKQIYSKAAKANMRALFEINLQ